MRAIIKQFSFILSAAFLLSACVDTDRYISVNGFAQGGNYTVKLNLKGVRTAPEDIKNGIDSILTLIDTTLSGYNKSSMLSRFNEGETVIPNQLFEDLYRYCAEKYKETGCALDVASGPLFDIWGFGFRENDFPTDEEVSATLSVCGMKRLKESVKAGEPLCPASLANDGTTVLPRLNFNAVAQGASCDLVAEYLHSIGVKDMLVDIGEIYCEGVNQAGKGWTIGVDRPTDGNETPGADLKGIWQSDGGARGIVTSGNYRKFRIVEGKKYAHTIDPRSGYPVLHGLLSATILAPTAADADAYATYCMVIGLEEAQTFIDSREDIEGYLIYDDGGSMREWASDGFNLLTSN